jgi:glucosyl-3-phosphoglycerate synthase
MGIYRLLGEVALDARVEQLVSRSGDAATVIAEELERNDAIVFGASAREGTSDQLGPVGSAIMRSGKPALIVRTRTPVASTVFLPRSTLPADRTERSRAISEIVDRWFAQNTFASTEFADLARLVEEKEKQGLRISVGLPALNEEATIGKVIRAIRSRLMERFPLVDELVVIDSDSTDRTREIARAEGIPVHVHQRTLSEQGSYSGKGEALWKSLYLLSGDLIVWCDTDITSFHPKFVYGILGPLLTRRDVQFVKAFYRRPLRVGGEVQATGGGRVTELTARPLLNLFFPELSGIVQPLSGEQGGRRTLLEQIPFFNTYGIETGLLIDTLQRAGLGAIAQVDMKMRIHRNQDLYALSKQAFEILQVAMRRVGEARGERLWEDANSTMKLIRPDDGSLRLDVHDIVSIERPPMITVPAYRAKRGL